MKLMNTAKYFSKGPKDDTCLRYLFDFLEINANVQADAEQTKIKTNFVWHLKIVAK